MRKNIMKKPVTLVIFKDGTIAIYNHKEELPNPYMIERTLILNNYKDLRNLYIKLKNIMKEL